MSPTPKATREPAAQEIPEKKPFGEQFSTLFLNGVERMAEVERRGLDLAVAQNAEVTEAWKKIAQKTPWAAGLFLFDLANNMWERYADTRKAAIDAMVDQSRSLADMTRERSVQTVKANETTSAYVQQAVERSVGVQKKALDHTAAHTKAVFDAFQNQFGFAGAPADAAADSFHKGVDTVIDAQKDLLDIAVH